MASIPKCPKCAATTFQMIETPVKGSNFRYNFIVCQSCSTAISVVEYYNMGWLIRTLAQKLGFPFQND